MKQYKKQIILTSIITILPMVIGIFLWKQLPDRIATHFGTDNVPNGWSSKTFTVFGLPLGLLAVHLFSITATLNDPKQQNIGRKMLAFVFWIIPIVSIITAFSIYGYALNLTVDIGIFANLIVAFVFIVLGNYMSKNKQNYTVGIKLPWTLNSQENWNRTHRMASRLWIAAGVFAIIDIFLKSAAALIVVIAAIVIIPVVYSFTLYKKGI